MRVLFWMISSGTEIQGGHQIQVSQTAAQLEALGVQTHIAQEPHPDLSGFDVVHNFGLDPEHLRRCRQYGIPVVTSSIYWDRSYALGIDVSQGGWRAWLERGRMGLVLLRSALQGRHAEKCEALVERQSRLRVVYEMSDLLLPNSASEGAAIARELQVSTPIHVVPNAVNPSLFRLPAPEAKRHGALLIGRFEPHKNILGLITAMRNSELPLTIAGYTHPHHEPYLAECKRQAARSRNITIAPAISHDRLVASYQAARVHVLPSWFETTGLVSLEAALCGCNVVTTNRGYTRDYFGDLAWYCDPAKPASIREAVELAHAAPFQAELRLRTLENYTWEKTARATLAGYEKVLRLHQSGPLARPKQDETVLVESHA